MTQHVDDARPLRRDAQRNRDRILAVAPEVFAEIGPDAPMEAIARRAGVGVGTLYRRFATRDALLLAILEEQTEQLARWADEAAAAPDAWTAFAGFLERGMSTPMADHVIRQLLLTSTPEDQRVERLLGVLLPSVARLVRHAQQAGVLREDFAPTDIPPLIVGLVAIRKETAGVAVGGADTSRRILALFLDGLRPGAATTIPYPPLAVDDLAAVVRQFRGAADVNESL